MSFGLSTQDIALAAQLILYVKKTCFTESNRADAHYLNFCRDVETFSKLLQKADSVLKRLSQQRRRELLTPEQYVQWEARATNELDVLIGGYREDLETCQQLLYENQNLQSRKATPLESMKWHLGGKQERVDELRASLASHVEKISLFTESETLQVLLDLKEDVGALRDDVEKLPDRVYRQFRAAAASDGRSSTSTGLLSLSQEICTRYEEGLDINAPPTYITGSDFPLKEGLDALMGAYQKSTVDFSKSALRIWGPPVEQWNNLFKAGFIFERMVSSKYLREAGQDSLWRWALESFYKKLRTEFARFEDDLEAGERDVLQLSPEYFQIWPAEVKRKRPQDKLTEAQEGELKVLQVQLEDPDERVRKDLVAFRRLHKDFTELRVVTVHSLKDPSTSEILIAPDDGNKVAKVHNVSIIPKYAYPLGYRVRPSKIIEVCFPGASRGFDYPFKMHEELLMFQQTWLGYKVVYEDPGCAYTVHYSHGLFSSKNLKGIGRVQIWQPKELPPIGPPASPNPDPRTPRARADSLYSQTNFTLRSSDSYSTVTGSSKGHSKPKAAKRPPSPVVVIFTETEAQAGQPSEPMVLFLRLEDNHQSVHVSYTNCNCASRNENTRKACKRVVLTASRGKFSITKLPATNSVVDISVFARPLRHPQFKTLPKIEDVQWIKIDTADPEKRELLQEAVTTMRHLHSLDCRDAGKQERAMGAAAERPKRSVTMHHTGSNLSYLSPSSQRLSVGGSSMMSTSSSGLSPTRADKIDEEDSEEPEVDIIAKPFR